MRLKLRQFLSDETGAMAIEYGLIAAGMSVALITLAGQTGDRMDVVLERLRAMLDCLNFRFSA